MFRRPPVAIISSNCTIQHTEEGRVSIISQGIKRDYLGQVGELLPNGQVAIDGVLVTDGDARFLAEELEERIIIGRSRRPHSIAS